MNFWLAFLTLPANDRMRALMIIHTGFQDQEVHYPFHRLREEGIETTVMAEKIGMIRGIIGTEIAATQQIGALDQMQSAATVFAANDLLILPGGVKAMEKLRQHQPTLTFIAGWFGADKLVACMCSGVQLLISADVVRGRRLTCYSAFAIDARNAGAIYSDAPVVRDGNLITSPHNKYLAEWMKATVEATKHENR